MLLMRTKPLMPKVEGKRYEKYVQNAGMADPGHDMPDINSNGTDVKTKTNIEVSRLRMAIEVVMAKKMQDAK